MKRRKLKKSIRKGIRASLRLLILGTCLLMAIYIMHICISTAVNNQKIHDQIEEEIFNNTYGKNIKVVPEVQK